MRVLMAGGGTGGHLFPAMAIAEEIKRIDKKCVIEFVGTEYGLEYRMKDSLGYPLNLIAIRGLPRAFSLGLFLFPFRLLAAIWQSRKVCHRLRPDIVVGTGGYVAGPPIIAAAMRDIPCVIQEQNSYPGLVTRKLASKASIVFLAYKRAESFLPSGVRRKFLGNPIRRSITRGERSEALKKFGLREDRKTILILGGSQGARRINEAVLRGLPPKDSTVQLLWQCGKRDYKEVAERLSKKDFIVSLFPFSDEMDLVYAAADIAIARAGALTIAELTACGLPSILIPYPYATANHQTHNAEEIVEAGAAEMIADADLDTTDIVAQAVELMTSGKLSAMRKAARKIGQPDAAAKIAAEIMALAGYKGENIDN